MNRGTFVLNEEVELLPGVEVAVAENATLEVAEGKSCLYMTEIIGSTKNSSLTILISGRSDLLLPRYISAHNQI